jgi:hypothetical protein
MIADSDALLRELLDRTDSLLARYVVFQSPAQRTAIALWVAHTHALAAFDVTPYLHIQSPEKECGKTRLLEVVGHLVPRPWQVVGPSEAVLFRKIEKHMPTLLLDEVDNIFAGPKSKTPEAGGLRQVLNAGYRRGAVVPRCAGKNNDKLVDFHVFGPKLYAGIGNTLPDTVASRGIEIALRRRKASEGVAKFKFRTYAAEAEPLRTAFAAWADDEVIARLRGLDPAMPEGMRDRTEEVWEPLVSISELALAEWPSRALAAALELSGAAPDTESTGVALLRAIRGEFGATGADRLLTTELLRALVDRESEPWSGWWGRDVDLAKDGETPRRPAMELARHLKRFGVQPKDLRVGDCVYKGYERASFEDSFARYLTRFPPDDPKGRDDATTLAAQGVEALPPALGKTGVATPETLAAQGELRRSDLNSPGGEKEGRMGRPAEAAFARDLPRIPIQGRNDATTLAAQGVETLRPALDGTAVATPETLAAQGELRRSDLNPQGNGNGPSSTGRPAEVAPDDAPGEACAVCGLGPPVARSSANEAWCVGCWFARCRGKGTA